MLWYINFIKDIARQTIPMLTIEIIIQTFEHQQFTVFLLWSKYFTCHLILKQFKR